MVRPIKGVNFDIRDNSARPETLADLTRLGYCRLVYIVNNKHRNLQDGEAFTPEKVEQVFNQQYVPQRLVPAAALYDPYIQKCIDADVQPIVVFTHQTFGEGWNLDFHGRMQNANDPAVRADWALLIRKLSEIISGVARKFGTHIVYEIWNEADQASGSAVGVPASCYAEMLTVCAQAIREVAGDATIIPGGLTGSDSLGYWGAVRNANRSVDALSGISIHPYNCSLNTFVEHGAAEIVRRLDDGIWAWQNRFPNSAASKSIWITEFGCGKYDVSDQTAAQYATTIFNRLETRWKNYAKAAVWFGWGPEMNREAGCYPVASSERQSSALWKAFSRNAGRSIPRAIPATRGVGVRSAIAPPPVPEAFNGHYELDTDNQSWRGAWKWARGGGGNNRWMRLLAASDAPYSTPEMRTAAHNTDAVEQAVSYLAAETTGRYKAYRDRSGNLIQTFCNIYVNDATRVLHCEIPNNPANTVVKFMLDWLKQDGGAAGWTRTTSGKDAQDHVNAGHVAIMLWSKNQPADHIALVRPGTGSDQNGAHWPRIAQAGSTVASDISSFATFSGVWEQDKSALAFYLHE